MTLEVHDTQDAATKGFDVHRFSRTRAVIREVLGVRLGVGVVLVVDPFVISSSCSRRGLSRDARKRPMKVRSHREIEKPDSKKNFIPAMKSKSFRNQHADQQSFEISPKTSLQTVICQPCLCFSGHVKVFRRHFLWQRCHFQICCRVATWTCEKRHYTVNRPYWQQTGPKKLGSLTRRRIESVTCPLASTKGQIEFAEPSARPFWTRDLWARSFLPLWVYLSRLSRQATDRLFAHQKSPDVSAICNVSNLYAYLTILYAPGNYPLSFRAGQQQAFSHFHVFCCQTANCIFPVHHSARVMNS